jgi:hypothetical protein
MSVVLRLIAFGGFLAHHANQEPFSEDNCESVRPRAIFLWVGILLVMAGLLGVAFLTQREATPERVTVQDVAVGRPLEAGSAYVSVSGILEPGSADVRDGATYKFSVVVLTDRGTSSSIFAFVREPLPEAGPDGVVAVTGLVRDGSTHDMGAVASAARDAGIATIPTSAIVLDATWHPTGVAASSIFVAAFLTALAVLMGLGMAAGLVPFRALRSDSDPLTSAGRGPLGSMRVWVTGIVDPDGRPRRYRHRPALLEQEGVANIRLSVFPWTSLLRRSGLGRKGGAPRLTIPSAQIALETATLRRVDRGTAYLVTATRPAIRIVSKHGSLVLDFQDRTARDRVFDVMRLLSSGE